MNPDLRAALRLLCEAYPAGSTVPVLREHVLELLAEATPWPAGAPMSPGRQAEVMPPADLTASELALRMQRHPSTCRAWLEAGRIPSAYLDSSRRWRVPVAALLEFEAAERAGQTQPRPSPSRPRKALTLNAWRTAS